MPKIPKIGCTGTGGTGKSTFCQGLATRLNIPNVIGVSRTVFIERGITEPDQERMTLEEKWHLQKAIFDRKLKQDLETDGGVFDRTLLDHMSYTLYRCAPQMDDSVYESMLELIRTGWKQYDVVFYFPIPPWKPETDGFRQMGEAYRGTVDVIIRGLIQRLELPVVTMPFLSRELMVDLAANYLRDRDL